MLKSVQRRITDDSRRLNLHSLERRRVRGDLTEVYKWMKGYNKDDINKVLIVREQGRTRSND